MKKHLQIIVVGAGPAGLAAAREAARSPHEVTVISDGPLGGRSGWHSLLPSKTLLHLAESKPRRSPGQPASPSEVQQLVQQINTVAQRYNDRESARLARLGVQTLSGRARLTGPHTLSVEGSEAIRELSFDRLILTSGSVPLFPEGLRPDGERVLAPRLVRKLSTLPARMLVIGAGATGCEFAHAFSALGSEVVLIADENGVLPAFDRALARALAEEFARRGVELLSGSAVGDLQRTESGVTATLANGKTASAEAAFIAVGRTADTSTLGLEAVGLSAEAQLPSGGLLVDEVGRTAVRHIFAAGDVTGPPLLANKALAQGVAAGRAAADLPPLPYDPDTLIHAIYTEPQLAQVGLTPERAGQEERQVEVRRVDYQDLLQPHVVSGAAAPLGFFELVVDGGSGAILGATAFGRQAAEVLALATLAISARVTVSQLAAVFPAYPTLSELVFDAARG